MSPKLDFCIGPFHVCSGPDDCIQTPLTKHWDAVARAGAETLDRRVRDMAKDNGQAREFETGATRSSDEGRYDPEGYMSPLVEERFSEYMLRHQYQADGKVRDSDNWQKGMPRETYMKGMKRHVLHLWLRHRGFEPNDPNAATDIEEDLCAILFNAQGYLHTLMAEQHSEAERYTDPYQPFVEDWT
jgi:hypothetical protein